MHFNLLQRFRPVRTIFPSISLFFLLTLFVGAPLPASSEVDTFGIVQLYPTKAGSRSWTSAHWDNGISRTVTYSSDPYDPTDWTEDHSSATDGFRIDGEGTMTMSGGGPRFHVNSMDSSKVKAQFFRDVEFTAFYQRRGTGGQNYAGMVAGVRSGPLGHASPGGDNCDATTYYARFRNDGKWDFEKELKHPGSTYWSGSGYNKQDPLWGGKTLPLNRWIGMKYIIYNGNNNSRVRLELYIDSVSNGNPSEGGHWEMVGTVTDSGTWPAGDVSGCGYQDNAIILEGHGTVLMRTDGDTAIYKMVSIREIEPVKTAIGPAVTVGRRIKKAAMEQGCSLPEGTLMPDRPANGTTRYSMYSLQGRLWAKGIVCHGGAVTKINPGAGGIYLVRLSSTQH